MLGNIKAISHFISFSDTDMAHTCGWNLNNWTSHISGTCLDTELWRCRKPLNQWQRSFQMKAALPLADRLATASDRSGKTGPWTTYWDYDIDIQPQLCFLWDIVVTPCPNFKRGLRLIVVDVRASGITFHLLRRSTVECRYNAIQYCKILHK